MKSKLNIPQHLSLYGDFYKGLSPNADSPEEEWLCYIQFCKNHHLQPELYVNIKNCPDSIKEKQSILLAAQQHPFKVLQKLKAHQSISEALKELQIPHFFVKGMVWSLLIYGDEFKRQSNDIDLIVQPKDVILVVRKLEDMGYLQAYPLNDKQLTFFISKRWEIPLVHPKTKAVVDLHWKLGYGMFPKLQKELDQDLWNPENIENITIQNINIPTLSPNKRLPYMLQNGSSECWSRMDIIRDYLQYKSRFPNEKVESKTYKSLEKLIYKQAHQFKIKGYNSIKEIEDGSDKSLTNLMVSRTLKGRLLGIPKALFLLKTGGLSTILVSFFTPAIDDVIRFKKHPQWAYFNKPLRVIGKYFLSSKH